MLCPVLVGRAVELRALAAAVDEVVAGGGRCVVLTGEPGIGKSRLAREVTSRAAGLGLRVVTGRAVPTAASAPYRPLTEVLLQLVRGGLIEFQEHSMQPWVPVLSVLAPSLTQSSPSPGSGSPAALGEALLQLLRLAGPAVVVFEDLHWADPDTVAVVEYIADNLAGSSVLCLVTVRDEHPSAASDLVRRQRGRSAVTHLHLDRLDADGVEEMVRACTDALAVDVLERVRRTADGVPLLVEELLASPGLPESFSAAVRERLSELSLRERGVVEGAAVLGRHFDWELLPSVCGESDDTVTRALGSATERLLVVADGTGFRFRHALTREAVLDATLPPRQRQLARAALAVLDTTTRRRHPIEHDLLADLALRAGDRDRAGVLLSIVGRDSLVLGALATAIDTLRRAAELLEGDPRWAEVEVLVLEALTLAGRVDDAAAAGARVIAGVSGEANADAIRLAVHVRLAEAAAAASRWTMSRHQLAAARRLSGAGGPGDRARLDIVAAELAIANNQLEAACSLADPVAGDASAEPALRCHALELVGRTHRPQDLQAARRAFEKALGIAEEHRLPIWRLRALHELGTIDLFDHAGTTRLLDARRAAKLAGAEGTVAVIDLQLAAGHTARWDLQACDHYAGDAVSTAQRLRLSQVESKAFALLAGAASMRGDVTATERLLALGRAAAPDDAPLDGFAWASRGMCRLVIGDTVGAMDPFERGVAILARLPYAEPFSVRALWPLLLAGAGDPRARAAVTEARSLGVGGFNLNEGMLGYADAVLAGKGGDGRRAEQLRLMADRRFVNCEPWRDLVRFLAAPAAFTDGWGNPAAWLVAAEPTFADRGLPALATACRVLLGRSSHHRWAAAGVTSREAEVLDLLVDGLGNKQIAARLHLSVRTVEKHVESLLRKTGTRSRTELAVATANPGTST